MAKRKVGTAFMSDEDEAPNAPPLPMLSQSADAFRDRRGDLIARAIVSLGSAEQYAVKIEELWSAAQDNFIDIGRYLTQAKSKLSHGEFLPMIETSLPFGPRVANRLMAVADGIDNRLLPTDRLPNSYSTVYELVQMRPDERAAALRENIVRPDVTREEVLAFKRRFRSRTVTGVLDRKAINRRLAKLREERQRIDDEIASLTRQLDD